MLMRNVMSKTKILTKQVQAIELNIADALEEKLNLQIEAAFTFSAQHGELIFYILIYTFINTNTTMLASTF